MHPKIQVLIAFLAAPLAARADVLIFQAGEPNGATTDTWISESKPDGDASGKAVVQWDGLSQGGEQIALIRFDDLFGQVAGQIKPTDTVSHARLEYKVTDSGQDGTVHEILVDWANGVTWNTFGGDAGVQPDEIGPQIATASGNSSWQAFDVTASIAAWAATPADNKGWLIQPTGSDGVELVSSEGSAASRVRLRVVINQPPPELLTFQSGLAFGDTTDTWIASGTPDSDNSAEPYVEWDGSNNGGENLALVRFDSLFGDQPGQIEPTDQITGARLEFLVTNSGDDGLVHEVLTPWANGVTWNTFGGEPGVQPDELGTQLAVAPGSQGIQSIDVTTSITAWALDPSLNQGWLIRPTGGGGVEFTSSEGIGARVRLRILINGGAPPLPDINRGPYLQVGTPTSGIIRWRTDAATTSRVNYGLSPGKLKQSVEDLTLTAEHEIQLTGLEPDTRYYYSVGTADDVLRGGNRNHFFETAPSTGTSDTTRIWAIGDSGTANADAKAVYDAYRTLTGNAYTDLWLMLGDNAYDDGTDAEYQDAVFDLYPELLRQTFLWSTLGNHEGHTANSNTQSGPYYDIFTFPRNGEAGGLASGTEAYYSFDHANIHFICLDSYETDTSPNGAMMTWMTNDVADTTAEWIIAFWHHPPYSKGSHNSDIESQLIDMRERALPILEAAGVDLVLCGHSHSYERSFLLDGHYGTSGTLNPTMVLDPGDGREDGTGAYDKMDSGPNTGAVYVVAGSSGKISGGALNHPAMYISLNELGSVVIEISGMRLDAQFLRDDGAVTDYFTIIKDDQIGLSNSGG